MITLFRAISSYLTVLAYFILFYLLFNSTAQSHLVPCNERNKVLTELADDYSEYLRTLAVDGDGFVIEVFRSEEKDTWTIIRTDPNTNLSCLMNSGHGWQDIPLAKEDVKS